MSYIYDILNENNNTKYVVCSVDNITEDKKKELIKANDPILRKILKIIDKVMSFSVDSVSFIVDIYSYNSSTDEIYSIIRLPLEYEIIFRTKKDFFLNRYVNHCTISRTDYGATTNHSMNDLEESLIEIKRLISKNKTSINLEIFKERIRLINKSFIINHISLYDTMYIKLKDMIIDSSLYKFTEEELEEEFKYSPVNALFTEVYPLLSYLKTKEGVELEQYKIDINNHLIASRIADRLGEDSRKELYKLLDKLVLY